MHINNNELTKFQNGTMDTRDMVAFLEHMDQCNYCLEEMLHQETSSDITAPSYLKNQIMENAQSPEVQISRAASSASHKVQLFYYSLRTAAGVIAALFMLFCIGKVDFSSIRPDTFMEIGYKISESTSSVTDQLNNFSNMLLNGGK